MHELRMPELGGTLDEATVVDWSVAVGDRVERGDVACVVATHEGVLDVETTSAGEVAEIWPKQAVASPPVVCSRASPAAMQCPTLRRPSSRSKKSDPCHGRVTLKDVEVYHRRDESS
jgi:hypothetical protein